jgi:hypothetical protein
MLVQHPARWKSAKRNGAPAPPPPGGVIYETNWSDERRSKEHSMASIVPRGFRGRRAADVNPARIPPGQYVT